MSIAGVKSVAFDLDDTLIDWTTGIGDAAIAVGTPEFSSGFEPRRG
jgi:FMN phosphatase YigB (HAD superfamily)